MKKFLVLCSVLALAAACAAPPTNLNTSVNSTNRGAEPTVAMLTESETIAKEKAVWDALKAKNYDSFAAMLATDYLEVGSNAVYDKAGIVSRVKDMEFTDATFADWKWLPLGKGAVLLTYNLTLNGKYKGEAIPPGPYRVGSAWAVRDGKWMVAFYQETQASKAEAAPASSPTPAGSPTAAGPAKANEIGMIADPVAREKAVWDALKTKNYDSFAAVLDDAQVEVGADGFHNKAETIAGVKMFDATKATASDFKTLKLSDEAELVTYATEISLTKVERGRASSIWVKRGDQWKAIYHQGTPAEEPAASPTPAKP